MAGIGIAKKGIGKVLKKFVKKGGKAIKRDAPFYGAVGAILTGRHAYNKIKKRPTDIDVVKKIIKKVKEK